MDECLMMNCKEATKAIEKDAEGRLSWRKRWELRFHLLLCKHCMQFRKHWNAISRMLVSAPSKASLSTKDKEEIFSRIDREKLNS